MKNILIIVIALLVVIGYKGINNYKNTDMGYINSSIVKACSYDMSKGMISECD